MTLGRRAALGALLLLPLAVPAAQAADPAAAAPIEALNQALLGIMKAGTSTPFPQRFNALAPVVDKAFDLPAVLRASIGPRFEGLPANQQADLLDAFRKFTVASYVANFNDYGGEKLQVVPGQREVGADLVVQTRIVPASGSPTPIDYVMRRTPDGWKAIDVLLNGSISQNAVKRSDFRSLVTSSSAQRLIDSLRRKVGELSGGAMS